jgi:release factor glutamine methyltransferase
VQYVVGLADFGPRLFHVAPGVLIPRPETYELCQWIVLKRKEERGERREDSQRTDTLRMLDIGTGSGCIACTLAAEMAEAEVTAWDISEEALAIARENARLLGVNVTFEKVDILRVMERSPLDLIVSNPPYICEKERTEMERNVLEHEPETALFVPDDDPLLFYRTIAQYGYEMLKRDGWLYFEINPLYVSDLRELLHVMGYHAIESKEDQYGKPRMIRAQKR